MNYPEARDYIVTKLVDELQADLTYHNIDHTLDVLNAAIVLLNWKKSVNMIKYSWKQLHFSMIPEC